MLLKRSLSLDGSPDDGTVARKLIATEVFCAFTGAVVDAIADAAAAPLIPPARRITPLSAAEFTERFELSAEELGHGSDGHVMLLTRSRDCAEWSEGRAVVKRVETWADCDDIEEREERASIIADEVEIQRVLSPHPHIVSLLDALHTDEHAFLVLERCDGHLGERWLPPRVIAADLLAGLAWMHSHHTIHLDVKPQNLLVTASGRLKIADFGHAVLFRSAEEAARGYRYKEEITTRWYRAPEAALAYYVDQFHGGLDEAPPMYITAAADIWAAACVIAESFDVAGECAPLFQASSNGDLIARVLRAFAPPPRGRWPLWDDMVEARERRCAAAAFYAPLRHVADASARDMLAGMLQLLPAMRYTAASALDHVFLVDH